MSGALRAWAQSMRPASQSYIALPLVLGQALAVAHGHPLRLEAAVLAQLFGLFDQWFIVWANDLADEATDRANATATPFSGGSRVLVEGRLTRAALTRAATLAALGCVGVAGVLTALEPGRWPTLPLAVLAIALLWAYSFPPIAASYRGGGEVLQAIGTALVLPTFGWLAQAGSLDGLDPRVLAVLFPSHLACALATTLPDAPSDAASQKRTAAVRYGQRATTTALVVLLLGSIGGALALHGAHPAFARPALSIAAAVPAIAALALGEAAPGTRKIQLRVFLALTSALGFEAGLIAALGWPP